MSELVQYILGLPQINFPIDNEFESDHLSFPDVNHIRESNYSLLIQVRIPVVFTAFTCMQIP